jgi:hypothetical protein
MVAVGLVMASYATWYRVTRYPPSAPGPSFRPVPGEDARVQVEVLNASEGVGLARIAMRKLRDAGIDVVYMGSDTGQTLDSTVILIRRGGADAAARVRTALGAGSVRAASDPARLVDVTVRLGRDFGALVRKP